MNCDFISPITAGNEWLFPTVGTRDEDRNVSPLAGTGSKGELDLLQTGRDAAGKQPKGGGRIPCRSRCFCVPVNVSRCCPHLPAPCGAETQLPHCQDLPRLTESTRFSVLSISSSSFSPLCATRSGEKRQRSSSEGEIPVPKAAPNTQPQARSSWLQFPAFPG